MGLWDTLSGRSSTSRSSDTSSPPPTSSSSAALASPQNAFSSYEAQDSSSLLLGTGAEAISKLHPLAGLDATSLDYLTLDDSVLSDLPGAQSALPSRGWSDDLCYGTGMTYIAALGAGGMWGALEGARRTPADAPFRLRLNGVLNGVTRRGPFLGNSAGVIALVYNGVNSTIGHYRGKHDWANSIAAGAVSGMLFKCTRGARPMLISGALVAGAAAAWTGVRKSLS